MNIEIKAQKLVHELVEEIQYEFRGKVILEANSNKKWYWNLVNKDSIAALGYKVGIPVKLLHEPERMYLELMCIRKRLRQYAKLGFGNLYCGCIIFFAIYLLMSYVLFGWPRAEFTKEIGKELIRARLLLYGTLVSKEYLSIRIGSFTDTWYDKACNEVLLEEGL